MLDILVLFSLQNKYFHCEKCVIKISDQAKKDILE